MIYYITGGARSGKSSYAQTLALSLSNNPIYLATARKWDNDFEKRIKIHQTDRDNRWENLEIETHIATQQLKNRVVVIDCITLWITNYFVDNQYNIETCLSLIKAEFDKLKAIDATLIIISNEIGMGLHADTKNGRDFTDLQGWVNQHIAKVANKAIFMVSGLPITVK
ncbi:MAG: bifunctional adenosylcobinamide kinase/adenosylcobinamide-phosphate guanylyltransferase [Sphingobacteriales bacterium]|nr:MAG: bifunctional adenosylcobinamide kinase/adenosylcobinamide-phosphate guanylyltransferase [Sphingobacteriales bacterium]